MFSMSAREVAAVSGATLIAGDGNQVLRDVVSDTREVGEGSTFVAFRGERVDGNEFATQAMERGAGALVLSAAASAAVLEEAARRGVVVLEAADDDPTAFLLALAGHWRRLHGWLCVGVTGSVGKTTTKDLLVAALSPRFRVHANEGNLNSVIGVPLTILRTPEDTEVLVCEMGMNHPGEIAAIARCARPRVGVITNIGTAHIGYLGSRRAIADAKAEIVAELCASDPAASDPADGIEPTLVVGCADDFSDYIARTYALPAGVAMRAVGDGADSVLSARSVAVDASGHPSFEAVLDDGRALAVSLALVGEQAVQDCLYALEVARLLGVDLAAAARAVGALAPASLRASMSEAAGGWLVLNDTYNASPASVAAALDTLMGLEGEGRRIAVLGEVGELGEAAHDLHGLMGSYLAARRPDLALFVGGANAATMAEAASIMGYPASRSRVAATAEEATEVLRDELVPGDIVLAKGSRAVGLERLCAGIGG